ncbi:MAG: SDR family oxidoreductase [Saprospiraceae bacterium]|nr:SDR family oxidoreductase [Saprospiraceae bacterium]
MKNVLITGANKGIGFEIARQLGKKAFKIWLAARNAKRGQQAVQKLQDEGISATFVELDVSQTESIQQAFQFVGSHLQKLDVLINNAGILLDQDNSLLQMPPKQVEETMQINALGPLYVTRAFLPLLATGSRVINVSSGAGAICNGMTTWAPVYSISKATENAITIQLAQTLQSRGISVNAVCPGWVRTDMGGSSASRSVEKGAETPVWMATELDESITGCFFKDKKEKSW